MSKYVGRQLALWRADFLWFPSHIYAFVYRLGSVFFCGHDFRARIVYGFSFLFVISVFFSVLFSHNIHKDADNGPEASCVVRQAFFCMSLQLSQLACSGLHRVYSMCLPFALIAAVGSIVVLFSECRSRNELRRYNATTNRLPSVYCTSESHE